MHFESAFDVAINPELPGSGRWSGPTYSFRRDGDGTTAWGKAGFHSTWGRPLVVLVHPPDSSGWVGFFEAGGIGGIETAVIATPDAHIACIVNDGAAYVVDVERPETHRLLDVIPARAYRALLELQLLVLWDWTRAAAIGAEGLTWERATTSAWMISRSSEMTRSGSSVGARSCPRRSKNSTWIRPPEDQWTDHRFATSSS
jgi:hypothetical protein